VSGIPYRVIRLVAGAAALLVSIYVFVSEAEVGPSVFGLKRFGRPAAASGATPWLDTMLPFGIALFAIVPALVGPFVGGINVAVGIAIVLPLFAGMSLGLAFGPYADQKVALAR